MTFKLAKYLRLFSLTTTILFFSGCYSYFAVNSSSNADKISTHKIARIRLKDNSEIDIRENSSITSIGKDSIQFTDAKGNPRVLDKNDILKKYEYHIDEAKTIYTIIFGSAAIYYILYKFGIIHWPVRV